MRLVLLSDTHGKHSELRIPGGDVLVHAGDFTMMGELETISDFNRWLGELPHKYKLVIAGNHDLGFERTPALCESMLTNCTYLRDKGIVIQGVRFWGSPFTPFFKSEIWAFHLRGYLAMKQHWRKIPDETDVLITHGPPSRVLDSTQENQYAGDVALLERVTEIKPLVHVFGHIHEGGGQKRTAYGAQVFNACVLDRAYNLKHPPFVVDL
jgi:Icc-related predicted phosphoesterase